MTKEDYSQLCEKIISGTAQYIDTSKMKSYNLNRNDVPNTDILYQSAVADKAPMSIIYTTPGCGRSSIIVDRANAIINTGVPADQIMVLTMNIAKTKMLNKMIPGVNIKTFSDFTHEIFAANFPGFVLSDRNTVVNTLRLTGLTQDRQTFIDKLMIKNPQDRISLTTLYVNQNIEKVLNDLSQIRRTTYAIESMICQNKMYDFENNPYNIQSILINGVQNMPVPILCSVLEYANKYHCNLFITGSPGEAIYHFNMAYNNAMNILASYSFPIKASIVRVTKTQMTTPILNTLYLQNNHDEYRNIDMRSFVSSYVTPFDINAVISKALSPSTTNFINYCISNKEPLLILTATINELKEVQNVLEQTYRPLYPNMNILNITNDKIFEPIYGEVLLDHRQELKRAYPQGITLSQLGYKLYEILLEYQNQTEDGISEKYKLNKELLFNFISNIISQAPMPNADKYVMPVDTAIYTIIDTESTTIVNQINNGKNRSDFDFKNANIILSSIHSAIDIRCDNVIVFLKNKNPSINQELYNVALSRANLREYIVFVNEYDFETNYQRYIKNRLTVK